MTKFQRIAVLALGLLLVVRGVRATESSEVDSSISPVEEPFSQDAHVSLRVPLQSGENFNFGVVTESSDGEESASELNRKLTNPVSSIWSIQFQFNSERSDATSTRASGSLTRYSHPHPKTGTGVAPKVQRQNPA